MLLIEKRAFPGIHEYGLILLVVLKTLVQTDPGNIAPAAPLLDQRNAVIVVNVEHQSKGHAQADHQKIVEPGDLAQLDLVHHFIFQAPVPMDQPLGELIDDMPGQLGVVIQQMVKFFFGDLDQ